MQTNDLSRRLSIRVRVERERLADLTSQIEQCQLRLADLHELQCTLESCPLCEQSGSVLHEFPDASWCEVCGCIAAAEGDAILWIDPLSHDGGISQLEAYDSILRLWDNEAVEERSSTLA